MDTQTLECVIEILGLVLIGVAYALIRNWARIKQSLKTLGETTRATRIQWVSILVSILGGILGYLISVSTYGLITGSENQEYAQSFLGPASVVIFFICAVPIYIPAGVVCGLFIYRFVQRKTLGIRANILLSLVISVVVGAIIAIPIYILGLIVAAV